MPAENAAATPEDDVTFASLGVPAPLVTELDRAGITVPFPVQAATLPDAFAGLDILGRAKTGSGKTLGFSLPLIARLAGGHTNAGRPRGLVLVPTRELATQVRGVLEPLAHAMGLRTATVFGGSSYRPQINALRQRTDIVVACPGRLADLIEQGVCDLGDVEVTVIDEADQMADLGFLPIVRRLLEATPSDGQRLLFSATLDSAIDVLARRFLHDPAVHSVDDNSSPAEIEHHVITIDSAKRVEVIAALAGGDNRSLIFTRTKHGAQRLARQLTDSGIPAAELHGNLAQGARSRNLAAFGSGAVRVMVATDIAARGIHVDGIDLVIHADPPAEHKAYVHRSGRTARGGATGVVITLQTTAQAREVRQLMQKAGVTPHTAKAFDPESEVLREIAGPPVPRVTLTVPVTELGQPAGSRSGKPGSRKPRQRRQDHDRPGHGRRDRDSRDNGSRDNGSRDNGSRGGGSRDRDRRDHGGHAEARDSSRTADAPAARPMHAVDDRVAEFDPARSRRAHSERPARSERPAYGDRPTYGDGPARSDRPAYDRSARSDRPAYSNRSTGSDRPAYGDRDARSDWSPRGDRPARSDWSPRPDRPGRSDRPAYGDRPARSDQPAYGDRPARSDRPAYGNRSARSDRPAYGDRPAYADRPGRSDGPSYGDRTRGDWSEDRPRDERPANRSWGRTDRPAGAGSATGRPGGDRRPAESGGRWGGSTARSGYSGGRSAAGKRRNSGQGRHF
jgi:superfamily II DNA/RNA helicase